MKYTLLIVLLILSGCGGSGERASRVVIQNKGSDTLVNVAQAWAEAYQSIEPNTAVAVTGGGSGTGFAALINGTVDIANASRSISDSEVKQMKAKGHDPVEFIVGYDALAVFLHSDNPINEMTFADLKAIYGEDGTAESWSAFNTTVPGCSNGEIVRVSRQNNSGTYAYFRETILGDSDFKLGSRDLHGSKDVVDLVENTPCAIGYSGLAYTTEHLKMACISVEAGEPCVSPSVETASSGEYPIARPLLMYTIGEPTGETRKDLDWILSDVGQCIIVNKGYAPVRDVECPVM
jgi:phosphate transport system substrate-binding protein